MTKHEQCYTLFASGLRWVDVAERVFGVMTHASFDKARRYAELHALAAGLPWPAIRADRTEARRPRQVWTMRELGRLRGLYAAGTPIDTIASTLGRSRRSITAAAERYGISHAAAYTGAKGRAYYEEHQAGATWATIARRHGITRAAAQSTANAWALRNVRRAA